MFCFDTDILVTVVRRDPPLGVIRRLAMSQPSCQFTTSISYGELVYSDSARLGSAYVLHCDPDYELIAEHLLITLSPLNQSTGTTTRLPLAHQSTRTERTICRPIG